MKAIWTKVLFYMGSLAACTIMAFNTGCASGGFKLTREYARWVNSKNIILRVILYILTFVVFTVTLIIDAVIFNTMDFWEGRVSQGTIEFKEGHRTFLVKHEFLPGTLRKQSTIDVIDEKNQPTQRVVLTETSSGDVELTVNGQLRARVRDIASLPVASFFGDQGRLIREDQGLFMPTIAVNK